MRAVDAVEAGSPRAGRRSSPSVWLPDAWNVVTIGQVAWASVRDADHRRHRLVHVHEVELLTLERAGDPPDGARAEHDVRGVSRFAGTITERPDRDDGRAGASHPAPGGGGEHA